MPTFFVFVFFSFCSGMKRCALLFKIKKKKGKQPGRKRRSTEEGNADMLTQFVSQRPQVCRQIQSPQRGLVSCIASDQVLSVIPMNVATIFIGGVPHTYKCVKSCFSTRLQSVPCYREVNGANKKVGSLACQWHICFRILFLRNESFVAARLRTEVTSSQNKTKHPKTKQKSKTRP